MAAFLAEPGRNHRVRRRCNAVEDGLVTSLARPGGNITGLKSRDLELTGKRLELAPQRAMAAFAA